MDVGGVVHIDRVYHIGCIKDFKEKRIENIHLQIDRCCIKHINHIGKRIECFHHNFGSIKNIHGIVNGKRVEHFNGIEYSSCVEHVNHVFDGEGIEYFYHIGNGVVSGACVVDEQHGDVGSVVANTVGDDDAERLFVVGQRCVADEQVLRLTTGVRVVVLHVHPPQSCSVRLPLRTVVGGVERNVHLRTTSHFHGCVLRFAGDEVAGGNTCIELSDFFGSEGAVVDGDVVYITQKPFRITIPMLPTKA